MTTRIVLLVGALACLPRILSAAGANTPFKTYYPQQFVLGNGATLVTAVDPARPNLWKESIYHQYAKLTTSPDYVQVPVPASSGSYVAPINRVTVRYSVRFSDSQNHNASWTLEVHANNGGTYHKVGTLTLKTRFIHVTEGTDSQFLPAPAGTSETVLQRWWEEATAVLTEEVPANCNIRVRKGVNDLASNYFIDAIDLERAPSPTTMPSGAIDITAHGAVAGDGDDDAPALLAAIAAARTAGRKVWIPPTPAPFEIKQQVNITSVDSGLEILGAGYWHSKLLRSAGTGETTPRHIFNLKAGANNILLHHLKMDFDFAGRRLSLNERVGHHVYSANQSPAPSGLEMHDLWLAHGSTPLWWDGMNANLHHNRVRYNYADGFHMEDRAANNLVTHNSIRGNGDDGLPSVVGLGTGGHDNQFRFNTIEGIYFGRGVSVIGGKNVTIADNIIRGGNVSHGILIRPEYGATKQDPVVHCIVSNNIFDGVGAESMANISTHFGTIGNNVGSPTDYGVAMNGNSFTNPPNTGTTGGVHLEGSSGYYMKLQGSGNTWPAYKNDKAPHASDSFTGQFN